MINKPFEKTGERFLPTQSNPTEVIVNIDRYVYALNHCIDLRVIDLGCGAGLGTYLYSLISKKVLAVDYNKDAFEYAKLYPFDADKIEFKQMDLEKETPGLDSDYDVAVAMEVLEHLSNPQELLKNLKVKKLVFSMPMASMAVSTWHKYSIRDKEGGLKDVHKLIEDSGYDVQDIIIQADRWIMGMAYKK